MALRLDDTGRAALFSNGDLQVTTERTEGALDLVESRVVSCIEQAVDLWSVNLQPAAESCPRDALCQHLVVQCNLGADECRQDLDVDIMVSYDLPTPDAVRVRLFGGPTYFSVNQQMVQEIRYRQAVLGVLNAVEITEGRYDDVKGSGWGANVGADVSYFFSRHVGVGGTVRFNTGTVTIDEPFTGEEADLKAGRTTFGTGLRLRF